MINKELFRKTCEKRRMLKERLPLGKIFPTLEKKKPIWRIPKWCLNGEWFAEQGLSDEEIERLLRPKDEEIHSIFFYMNRGR